MVRMRRTCGQDHMLDRTASEGTGAGRPPSETVTIFAVPPGASVSVFGHLPPEDAVGDCRGIARQAGEQRDSWRARPGRGPEQIKPWDSCSATSALLISVAVGRLGDPALAFGALLAVGLGTTPSRHSEHRGRRLLLLRGQNVLASWRARLRRQVAATRCNIWMVIVKWDRSKYQN